MLPSNIFGYLCDAHTQNTQHFSFRCGPYCLKSHETQATNSIAVSQPHQGPHPILVLPSLQGESSCMRTQLGIPPQEPFGQACGWWLYATHSSSALLFHVLTVRGCAGTDRACDACPQQGQPHHLSQAPLHSLTLLSCHRNPFWP